MDFMCSWYDECRILPLWSSSTKLIAPGLPWEKQHTSAKWRKLYKISDCYSSKPQKVIKNKEHLRRCYSPEEPKEISWLNMMSWIRFWNKTKQKKTLGKGNLMKVRASVNVLILVHNLWQVSYMNVRYWQQGHWCRVYRNTIISSTFLQISNYSKIKTTF